MPTVKDISNYLETIAPLNLQESYDNAGLIVGEPNVEITQVLISLDTTEEVVDEAIDKGCNLIVAHHPIVFKGLKKLNGNNYVERVVMKALRNNIAIYASHTNLDSVQNGVNKKIADIIQLEKLEFLQTKDPEGNSGTGMIGSLANAMSSDEFLTHLKAKMNLSCIRHTSRVNQPISKVAICGGSGSFLLQSAIRSGADAFVTADFKYHEFFDAENKLIIADIGHYESEVFTKDLFCELLREKFTNIALVLSEVNTNPISYY